MDESVLKTMRYMAWNRAKGELQSMLDTYWSGSDEQFTKMKKAINNFIEDVEDNGKQE
tara:strand:+ start:284 stop:457 length:174 start_codon:yes stop_codon:yes gene_type:complete